MVRIKTIDFPDRARRATMTARTRRRAMDMSDFVVGFLVRERLETAREQARRRALVPRRADESLRVRLGRTLIALGRRLLHEVPAPQRVTS
jgi:hypothetical protein